MYKRLLGQIPPIYEQSKPNVTGHSTKSKSESTKVDGIACEETRDDEGGNNNKIENNKEILTEDNSSDYEDCDDVRAFI